MSTICSLCVPGNLNPPCAVCLLPALCPSCVRHAPAQVLSPFSELDHHVLHVSAMRPPRAHSLSAQVMCPLKPRPRFWTFSPLGLLWREPWFPQVKPFLTIAQPIAFKLHARQSIYLAFILVPQIRPLQAHPVLQKLFGV